MSDPISIETTEGFSNASEENRTSTQEDYELGSPGHMQLIAKELRARDDVLEIVKAQDFSQNVFDMEREYLPFAVTTSFSDFAECMINRQAIFIHSSEKHEAMALALNKPNPSFAYFVGQDREGEVERLYVSVNQDEFLIEIGGEVEDFRDLMIYSVIHEFYEAWENFRLGSEYSFDGRSPNNRKFPTSHDRANFEEFKAAARDGKLERLKEFNEALIVLKMEETLVKVKKQRGDIDEDRYWLDVARILAKMDFMA